MTREQPALYDALDATRGRYDNSNEAIHLVLAIHGASICEHVLQRVCDALRNSIREDEDLYAADAKLCQFLRSRGICLADARGWLY